MRAFSESPRPNPMEQKLPHIVPHQILWECYQTVALPRPQGNTDADQSQDRKKKEILTVLTRNIPEAQRNTDSDDITADPISCPCRETEVA